MNYLETIKKWISEAEALVISTGAGMGVDSGLADYRGNGGQWGQVESEAAKSIFEVVNPNAFLENPAYSWEYFASRIIEYQNTEPHYGFQILKKWIKSFGLDSFILTSNIDSHFQKAGFDEAKIRELHGSLAYFQSAFPSKSELVWKNELSGKEIIENSKKGLYPTVPNSSIPARPNVYMFRDLTYIKNRSENQKSNFEAFLLANQGKKIVVIEIGSGPHVQTVRLKTRMLKSKYGANIIRINPKDFKIKPPHIGIAKGALAALTEIDEYLNL